MPMCVMLAHVARRCIQRLLRARLDQRLYNVTKGCMQSRSYQQLMQAVRLYAVSLVSADASDKAATSETSPKAGNPPSPECTRSPLLMRAIDTPAGTHGHARTCVCCAKARSMHTRAYTHTHTHTHTHTCVHSRTHIHVYQQKLHTRTHACALLSTSPAICIICHSVHTGPQSWARA